MAEDQFRVERDQHRREQEQLFTDVFPVDLRLARIILATADWEIDAALSFMLQDSGRALSRTPIQEWSAQELAKLLQITSGRTFPYLPVTGAEFLALSGPDLQDLHTTRPNLSRGMPNSLS